jgi:hypothetical protein
MQDDHPALNTVRAGFPRPSCQRCRGAPELSYRYRGCEACLNSISLRIRNVSFVTRFAVRMNASSYVFQPGHVPLLFANSRLVELEVNGQGK